MSSHVQVNELPPAVGDEQEDIERPHGHRLNREEVRSPYVGCMVPEKRSPGLRGWAAQGFPTVASDGLSADIVAQLAEFADDAYAPPARVLSGQASDQILDLSGDARSSRTPTTPAPPVGGQNPIRI